MAISIVTIESDFFSFSVQLMLFLVQWIPVNWDSDKGDFRLIGIEI